MKEKTKKVVSYFLTIATTLCVGFILVAFLLRPQVLDIGTVDLNTIADGEYIGVCQNKILFAVVKVEIQTIKLSVLMLWSIKPPIWSRLNRSPGRYVPNSH